MPTYRPAAPGIVDHPVPRRETLAGVLAGSDGTIVLEVEEIRFGSRAREYAEVPFTVSGAERLRDALGAAIRMVVNAAPRCGGPTTAVCRLCGELVEIGERPDRCRDPLCDAVARNAA